MQIIIHLYIEKQECLSALCRTIFKVGGVGLGKWCTKSVEAGIICLGGMGWREVGSELWSTKIYGGIGVGGGGGFV